MLVCPQRPTARQTIAQALASALGYPLPWQWTDRHKGLFSITPNLFAPAHLGPYRVARTRAEGWQLDTATPIRPDAKPTRPRGRPTSKPAPSVVPETDVAAALNAGHRYALWRAKGRPWLLDVLVDAATDGVLRASRAFDPHKGTFPAFARACVELAVRHAIGKAGRRQAREGLRVELDEDTADRQRGPEGLPLDLSDLPDPLREAVLLYFIDGLTLEEAGERLGITHEGVRKRLHEAARIVGRDIGLDEADSGSPRYGHRLGH